MFHNNEISTLFYLTRVSSNPVSISYFNISADASILFLYILIFLLQILQFLLISHIIYLHNSFLCWYFLSCIIWPGYYLTSSISYLFIIFYFSLLFLSRPRIFYLILRYYLYNKGMYPHSYGYTGVYPKFIIPHYFLYYHYIIYIIS